MHIAEKKQMEESFQAVFTRYVLNAFKAKKQQRHVQDVRKYNIETNATQDNVPWICMVSTEEQNQDPI